MVISNEKNLEIPLWNPYAFSGTPMLANFQGGVFYPFNLLFFILPFYSSWSIYIFLEPLLSCLFLYLYLRNLKLDKLPSLFGSVVFAFSGFSIAWMEWGNILHTALWLPLILLATDKIISNIENQVFSISNKKLIAWIAVYVFSLVFAFIAGHLQTFFYLWIFSFAYFAARWWQYGKRINILVLYILLNALFLILSSVQWIPTLQFINLSLRSIDQSWRNPGWFIPWQNLVQFIIPDFFGNPATLNYWGIWNYAEFIGYVGILPLNMAAFALFFRHDKKTLFFGTAFFLSLIFSLPTIFAKIPYVLQIPFISTSQPTRLMFVADFSLAVLSALGINYFFKSKKGIFYILGFFALLFSLVWGFVLFFNKYSKAISSENLGVAKHNLTFPTVLFILVLGLIFIYKLFSNRKILYFRTSLILQYVFLLILIFDLFRFGWKFTPFTNKNYLFPQTPTIDFLQKQKGIFRIMTTDSTIFPPNFSTYYHLQSVDGYDPLFLKSYGELVAAYGRGSGNIQPPYGFNRIITPQSYDGRIIDLLGVKYILSVTDLVSTNLEKVFQEGNTRVYKNNATFDRAFFISNTIIVKNEQEAINALFDLNYPLKNRAVVNSEDSNLIKTNWSGGKAEIISYKENQIEISTENQGEGFLILTDTYYPTWHAKIDGKETKIYLTDFNFRGIVVPKGQHNIVFCNSIF